MILGTRSHQAPGERGEYRALLSVTAARSALPATSKSLPVSAALAGADRNACPRSMPTRPSSTAVSVRDAALPLRDGVARLLAEARDAGCRLAIA